MPLQLFYQTNLTHQEIQWILEQRLTRLTDNQEVLIYPMGAERYLSSLLFGYKNSRFNIKKMIVGKDILIIPGFGNSGFLFAEGGAQSITIYDKDPVTIAWMKAFKKYYHYREYDRTGHPYPSIGELLAALTCWYPPRIQVPKNKFKNKLLWLFQPQLLRRAYIFYMLYLAQSAIQSRSEEHYELKKNIQFFVGEIDQVGIDHHRIFDTAFVPYLLGVKNGIEQVEDIVTFMDKIYTLVPQGHILVNPTRKTKEFYLFGQRYFNTTKYSALQNIPELKTYQISIDEHWFRTQGLAIFCSHAARNHYCIE